MASWYDYVFPGSVGPAISLAKGNDSQAFADMLGLPGQLAQAGYNKYHNAINEQKAGYQTAADESNALGSRLGRQAMQGLGLAEDYYAPARAMSAAAFGSPSALRK